MKVGNISQTVFKRSVQKQLNNVREEVLYQPSKEENCIAVKIEEDCHMISAESTAFGTTRETGFYALIHALNDLMAWKAEPLAVSISIMLPVRTSEAFLKSVIEKIRVVCLENHISIAEVKTEVNPVLLQLFVSVRAYGQARADNMIRIEGAKSGQDIVLCGYVGLEGTLRIVDEQEKELKARFVPSFIRKTKELKTNLMNMKCMNAVADANVTAIHQIGSGGIFASLWDLAEASGTGLTVELSKMSIRQETVEICEYYNLNPYHMTSAGSFLMVTSDGDALVKILEREGVRASRLGVTTDENARVITSGDEKRYLDRPAPDELMLWWQSALS